jgi:hypothetical protein
MSLKKNLKKIDGVISNLNTQTEKALIQAYAKSLKDIRAQLAEIYAKYTTAGSLTYADMAKYGRLESLLGEINAQLKDLTGKSAKEIKSLQEQVYSESYYRTAFAIEFEAQAKLRYVLLNPKVIEASVQNPISGLTLNKRLLKNKADIIIKTREQITQGLIKGEGYVVTARRLKDVYENDLAKQIRIVRTESHRNQNQGILDSFGHANDLGVKTVKVWEATLDSKTRDSHQDMDGQKVDIDEPFIFKSGDNAGQEVEAPGLSGIAEEDINCRCVVREEIVGYEPEIRGARDEGNIPYVTYEEWAADKGID